MAAGRNRLFAKQGRASANAEAARVRTLFQQDRELSDFYNNQLAGGKWRHLMDQTHIGYTGWQEPKRNMMPMVTEFPVPDTADFGVAVEESVAAWPGSDTPAALPIFDSLNRQRSYFEIFARGVQSIACKFTVDQPWIAVSEDQTPGRPDRRFWVNVDWEKVPPGESQGNILVHGGNRDDGIAIHVTPSKPPRDRNSKRGDVSPRSWGRSPLPRRTRRQTRQPTAGAGRKFQTTGAAFRP